MSRAIVFHGDGTWEERDLPAPDPAVVPGSVNRWTYDVLAS